VKLSDIAGLPIEVGAAVRRRRLFHPFGVLAHGSVQRMAPTVEGLPLVSTEVVGRISKAVGLPGSLPDIVGLAWRMPPAPLALSPWDVLLASAEAGPLSRFLLHPIASWSDVTLSSLMPLRHQGQNWWISARLTTTIEEPGVGLDDIEAQISGGGVRFEVDQACGLGEFRPLARLELNQVIPPGHDTAFDPTTHSHPEVTLFPGWLNDFRRDAYRRSRQGRERRYAVPSGD
jgi:hypothetical protein